MIRWKFIAKRLLAVIGILGLGHAASAAEIKIGVVLSQTGAAANFNQSIEGTVKLWPADIEGHQIKLLIEDDRSDITASTTAVRRLIDDQKVDLIVGPVVTPMAVAAAPLAVEGATPLLPLAPVPLTESNQEWVFNLTRPLVRVSEPMVRDMARRGIKTVGMIGYSDTWGDQWVEQLRNHGKNHGIEVIADERYGRSDTSVTGQVLKLISLDPDAVLVAASYAGAALPQLELVERGYSGKIYQTQGIDRKSFMSAAGDSAEGLLFTADPQAVARALPENSPTRAESLRFVDTFEEAYGPDTYTSSAAFTWDVIAVLRHVLPEALKESEPGTAEFRLALKNALEQAEGIVGSNGVYSFSADDHWGLSNDSSVVIATVKNGQWQLAD